MDAHDGKQSSESSTASAKEGENSVHSCLSVWKPQPKLRRHWQTDSSGERRPSTSSTCRSCRYFFVDHDNYGTVP